MAFTVSQVARMAGVSVRALHHYDEIGLLRPSGRSEAGYRLYAQADLERLQQVMFYRALEVPLEEIARIMTDPEFDVGAALRVQRQLLAEKAVQVRGLIAAVDAAIARLEKGETSMTTSEELFEVFEGFDPQAHEAEAEQRWGKTKEWEQSRRRTARYTKQDWLKIKAEGGEVFQQLAALMKAGKPAGGPEAMDAAELHRQYRWFYDCSPAVHRGLGELYVADQRFTASVDQAGPGLSEYCREAFAANAARSKG
jgi:MerR family transcriptional regulator, thiopeptide resistance regulator